MKPLVLAILVSGCVDADPSLATSESHIEADNRLATNRLATNRLATNRLATNGLSSLSAAADLVAMADDDGGRELLTYMVSCALPAGASIDVTTSSGVRTFQGLLGLAPRWLDAPLSLADRRWVSACLLARVNYYGVTVHLSMRGSTPALATTTSEVAAYPHYEGAFWGDLFGSGDPLESACTSRFKSHDPQMADLPLRQCTVLAGTRSTWCGFSFAGVCEDVCSSATGTDGYARCAGETEVINVYLLKK
jgi:hypothetical protein